MFNHILIEAYCLKKDNDKTDCPVDYIPQYSCLFNRCPYLGFTSHENAFCYVNEKSEAEYSIAYGGEMITPKLSVESAILLWKQISKNKIEEGYQEYLSEIKKLAENQK